MKERPFQGAFMPYDQSTKTLTLKRISATFVLHRDPVIAGQLRDDPIAVESPDTTVFLAAKHVVRIIIDRDVVDVSHAGSSACASSRAVMIGATGQNCSAWAKSLMLSTLTNT